MTFRRLPLDQNGSSSFHLQGIHIDCDKCNAMSGQQFYDHYYLHNSRMQENVKKAQEKLWFILCEFLYFFLFRFLILTLSYLFVIFHVTIFCCHCCCAAVFDVKVPKAFARLVLYQLTHIQT